jgi:hypothetical protein
VMASGSSALAEGGRSRANRATSGEKTSLRHRGWPSCKNLGRQAVDMIAPRGLGFCVLICLRLLDGLPTHG